MKKWNIAKIIDLDGKFSIFRVDDVLRWIIFRPSIPQLTRYPCQQEDCDKQNSGYVSDSIDIKIQKYLNRRAIF